MALLETSNLSKIYTSDDNIAVGISHVNLMFDKNEIVAITGGSGSGKSTLLRVLGGLESYEEGEMYFNGLPTSHYTSDEWAEYLNNNISFIFQEYNILDSFTVLENVMYALTDIKSKKERKQRATEIIEKVGLKDRIKAKGGHLSGGEKQRTVIARAIAKNSPIILADEPTGNLDSKTAHDIIDLLQEISKDKLVVIVTHNYEDVKRIITRHIRLFDGKVEDDEPIGEQRVTHESSKKADDFDFTEEHEFVFKKKGSNKEKTGFASDGVALGMRRYSSRPKQNILTTFLLIIAALLVFITCVALIPSRDCSGDIIKQPGRLLVVKQDNTQFSQGDLNKLQAELAAKDSVLFDSALDTVFYQGTEMPEQWIRDKQVKFKLGYDLNYELDEGEPIKNAGEVVLKVPYTSKGVYTVGQELHLIGNPNAQSSNDHSYGGGRESGTRLDVKVVGISYYLGSKLVYVDMHKYDAQYLAIRLKNEVFATVITKEIVDEENGMHGFPNDMGRGTLARIKTSKSLLGKHAKLTYADYDGRDVDYECLFIGYGKETSDKELITKLDPLDLTVDSIKKVGDDKNMWDNPDYFIESENFGRESCYVLEVSEEFFSSVIMPKILKQFSSTQVSLYFNTEEEARAAADTLTQKDNGNYVSFVSMDYKEPKAQAGVPVFISIIVAVVVSLIIVLSLVKIISATKADVSIYRTMGISDRVIKGSTYVQVLLDMIPSLVITIAAYFVCFFTKIGEQINFMPITWMIFLCLAVFAMGLSVAVGFNKVIYKEDINKGLRRTNK